MHPIPRPHPLLRTAYAVYAIAHRADGHTAQREALERLAHAALRDALVGLPRTSEALGEIGARLEAGAFARLRDEDQAALRAALRTLDACAA